MKHLNLTFYDIKQIKPMNSLKVRSLRKYIEKYKRAFRESRELEKKAGNMVTLIF